MVRPDLSRHDLVRVEPAGFADFAASLRAYHARDASPVVFGWVEAGRPLIVRRFVEGESRLRVPLGLPLPPQAQGPRRIRVALAPERVAAFSAPTLVEVHATATAAWRPTLDALIALGARHRLTPRPFGSLLWQALTGLDYLTPASDLDVLWPLAGASDPDRLRRLLDGIARIAEAAPMRLDGEILMPDGRGVHWRELREAPDGGTVLVKDRDGVEMRPAALFGQGPDRAMGAAGAP